MSAIEVYTRLLEGLALSVDRKKLLARSFEDCLQGFSYAATEIRCPSACWAAVAKPSSFSRVLLGFV